MRALRDMSDETLLRRVDRFGRFASLCIERGDRLAMAMLAMQRMNAARAELLRRYPD